MGATGVSFAPFRAAAPNTLLLASCGCDGLVQLWSRSEDSEQFAPLRAPFKEHSDWVRDVVFSPDGANPFLYLASCGQDKKVVVRRIRQEHVNDPTADWDTMTVLLDEAAWRLSWSPCGTMLLVTTGDSEGILLTETPTFTDPWTRTNLAELRR